MVTAGILSFGGNYHGRGGNRTRDLVISNQILTTRPRGWSPFQIRNTHSFKNFACYLSDVLTVCEIASFEASAAKELRTALFWVVITQGAVVISYRRYGTTYRVLSSGFKRPKGRLWSQYGVYIGKSDDGEKIPYLNSVLGPEAFVWILET